MDEFKTGLFNTKDDESSRLFSDLSKTETSLLDMDSFETVEAAIKSADGYGDDFSLDPIQPECQSVNDLLGNIQNDSASTTRPLMTSSDEFISEIDKFSSDSSNRSDFVNIERNSAFHDIGADTGAVELNRHSIPEPQQCGFDEDQLLIALSSSNERMTREDPPCSINVGETVRDSPISSETLPKIKDPKIGIRSETESEKNKEETSAYQASAQPVLKKREVAMESEKVGSQNSECDCPFSPGAWFNPNKLHPVVAKYVYWQDPKRSAIALTASLVFLFSFKIYSVISVAAYLIIALLIVTLSFRIYKEVLQAIQKSNDGHPFKDYLEMDITLSQDKMRETVETLIQHLNCVFGKLRSLVLVEDLVDTIKLLIFAWGLTYVGAWFNGLTLVILVVVSAFTLPKVYELNKAQIDTYAELVCTKGKEIIEMVNAKMPMGKKKKDQ